MKKKLSVVTIIIALISIATIVAKHIKSSQYQGCDNWCGCDDCED